MWIWIISIYIIVGSLYGSAYIIKHSNPKTRVLKGANPIMSKAEPILVFILWPVFMALAIIDKVV